MFVLNENSNGENMRFCVLLFIALLSNGLEASCSDLDAGAMLRTGKHAIAVEKMLAYDKALLNAIPRLSPAEEEWLEIENGASLNRRLAAYRTNEYARKASVDTLERRVSAQSKLLNNYQSSAPNINNQIYNWAELLSEYMLQDYPSYVGKLHDGNILNLGISERSYIATSDIVGMHCSDISSAIIGGVLLPKLIEAGIY